MPKGEMLLFCSLGDYWRYGKVVFKQENTHKIIINVTIFFHLIKVLFYVTTYSNTSTQW